MLRHDLRRSAVLVAVAVFSTLLISTLLSGCGGMPDDAAATVNGVTISKDYLNDRYRVARGASPALVPEDMESEAGIKYRNNSLLQQLISEEMEKQEADRRQISVGEEEVDQSISETVEDIFLGSLEKMREDLSNRGLQESDIRAEAYRRLLHWKLLESIREDVPVSDEEVLAAYEDSKQNYVFPATVQIRQIVVGDEATAVRMAELIASGEDFATLAQQSSIDAASNQKGGLLDSLPKDALPKEVGETAFSLEPGQVSAPFKSELGWYVIRLESFTPPASQSFEEVKDEIRYYESNKRLSERYKSFMEDARSSDDIKYAVGYSPE